MVSSGTIAVDRANAARVVASGNWKTYCIGELDKSVSAIEATVGEGKGALTIDVSDVASMDVAGAWLLYRLSKAAAGAGREAHIVGLTQSRAILLEEVRENAAPPLPPKAEKPYLLRMLTDIGNGVLRLLDDFIDLLAMFGRLIMGLAGLIRHPSRIRPIAVLHHMEYTGVRAIPIVALISGVIGAIIAQQGAFQLRKFGAESFSVDLVAILTLREVGVLITSIMIAGRSGSAFTAEIGSMKMREEIDAMRVLQLDPVQVLVVPRVLALMITLPILTLLADFAGLFGAGLVSWFYIDLPPEAYITRLRVIIGENTFWVGLIKAPFMAMVIALVSCREGLNVGGSAESLGQQTTAAVVKSIFAVIVMDGLFAMFFSAINY